MDAKKATWGGKRPGAGAPKGKSRLPGAGRPVQSVKMKNDDQWLVQGLGLQQMATVKVIQRNKIQITLTDGTEITLIK